MAKTTSNISSIMNLFFKQITELGSLTILCVIAIFSYFIDARFAIKLFIGIIAATAIGSLIKILFFYERPQKQKHNNTIERIDASSFPSIHSARITILTLLLIIYSGNLLLQLFLAVIGILVIYSRVYLKKHYYRDVIGGLVLGTIISIIIYYIP